MSIDKSKIIQYGSNSASYVIDGDPIPWARTGVNFKHRRHYDVQKPIKYVLAAALIEQHGNRPLFKGALELSVIFYMRMPRAGSGVKSFPIGSWHSKKPDWSNLVKFIEDIGNEILYKDDAQFARCIVEKIYGEDPRTEFTITELR